MRDLDQLYDALGRVLAAAENHQQAADRSIQAMNKASANLEHKANTLDDQLSREMTRAMDLAVADAAKALTAQFKKAHELAKQAETRYRNSVRWAAWKVFATATVFGVERKKTMTLTRMFDLIAPMAAVMLLTGILLGGSAFVLSDGGPLGVQLFNLRWWLVLDGIVGAALLGMRHWLNRST